MVLSAMGLLLSNPKHWQSLVSLGTLLANNSKEETHSWHWAFSLQCLTGQPPCYRAAAFRLLYFCVCIHFRTFLGCRLFLTLFKRPVVLAPSPVPSPMSSHLPPHLTLPVPLLPFNPLYHCVLAHLPLI